MYRDYSLTIESKVADVLNCGARFAGVSGCAKFLEHFANATPWAHMDIAGVAMRDGSKDPLSPAGATGYGVRTLVNFASKYQGVTENSD